VVLGVVFATALGVNLASLVVVAQSMRVASQSGVLVNALLKEHPAHACKTVAPTEAPKPALAPPPEPSRTPGSPLFDAFLHQGPLGATDFQVARSTVEAVLAERAARMDHVHFVPRSSDDELPALRVTGATRGSLLASVGLEDGDLVWAVNGFAVASPEKALEAYARLRNANILELWLTRKGVLRVQRYVVT